MLALFLIVISTALAGQVGLSAGAELTSNDPFLTRTGPRVGVARSLGPHLRIGASGAWYPNRGTRDWNAVTQQLEEDYHLLPDLSRMVAHGRGELWVLPLVHPVGRLQAHTGAFVGLGAMATEDDLEALHAEGDPYGEATRSQVHPASTWGLCSELGTDRVRGRLRAERTTYLETVSSYVLEMKGNMLWGLEVTVWLGE
jgi:hypothetical protein